MANFSSADAVFAYLDRFISADVWAIPKHLRAERLALLAEAGGHPERCAPVFHVAGSKGKGSVTGMLAAVLDAAGKRVAWYVSPHVADVRERIMLGKGFLDEAVYTACGDETEALCDRVRDVARPEYRLFQGKEEHCYPPTYFELLTFYSFFCARMAGADMQVVETGMGGRFDPTNIVDPLVSVISVIELEHTAFLGRTLAEIAFEKAGIIKPGKPVVLAEQDAEALPVFQKAAAERNAPFYYLPDLVSVEQTCVSGSGTAFTLVPKNRAVFPAELELHIGIPGMVQAKNAALAVAALKIAMPEMGDDLIKAALRGFSLPARFEKIADSPPVVIDGAHTALSVELAIREWVALYGDGGVLLFGCAEDKNVPAMACALLPHFSSIIITNPGSYKVSYPEKVFEVFVAEAAHKNPSCKMTLVAKTLEAVDAAVAESRMKNLPLFCSGSFYLAAGARGQILRTGPEGASLEGGAP
ncbi:MAG: tetrahydrofolate synthase [Spirochaetaceae bacterium]|nr:tetrahydrofolate synthase [Spirochaetaceae bacterium]